MLAGIAACRVLQSPELALAIGQAAGVLVSRGVAEASRTHGEGMRLAFPALVAACPPEVYVFGGERWRPGQSRVVLADAERFIPAEERWETIQQMATRRMDCAAVACRGRIYVLGGESEPHGVLDSVEAFDPIVGCWRSEPSMLSGRFGGAAAANAGVIYALGGRGPGSSELRASRPGMRRGLPYRTLDAAERMDLAVGRWEPLPPMPSPREYFAAAVVGGRLYAIGGCNDHTFWAVLFSGTSVRGLGCDVFDLSTGQWSSLFFPPAARPVAALRDNSMIAAAAGRRGPEICVVGGYADGLRQVDVAERVDLEACRSEELPPMLAARAKCAAAASAGDLYVVGGHHGTNYWASAEHLDVASRSWRFLPPMSTARSGCAAAAIRR